MSASDAATQTARCCDRYALPEAVYAYVPTRDRADRAYGLHVALHRNPWVQLFAALALGVQLLLASGLAMSAPPANCESAHTQAVYGDECQGCGTHDDRTGVHSNGACKVACVVASVAAPLPCGVFTMQAPRDVAPTSAPSLRDSSSHDDLLRPPAEAAVHAA
jgi:hypothetical protein